MSIKKELKRKIQKIEGHLRNYHQYKIGIKNLELQLESIMPKMTASYELKEGSLGTFVVQSSTENYAIDRIESKRALDLHEQIERYHLIVNCVDEAMNGLDEEEKKFVEYRYFNNNTVKKLAITLGYGESTVFCIRNKVMDKLIHSLNGLEQL